MKGLELLMQAVVVGLSLLDWCITWCVRGEMGWKISVFSLALSFQSIASQGWNWGLVMGRHEWPLFEKNAIIIFDGISQIFTGRKKYKEYQFSIIVLVYMYIMRYWSTMPFKKVSGIICLFSISGSQKELCNNNITNL